MNVIARGDLRHRHTDHDGGHDHPATSVYWQEHHPKAQASLGAAVFFDMPSGAGGDMIVAALCDMAVPWKVITDAVAQLKLTGVSLELLHAQAGAIGALRFCVHVNERDQSERSYAQIRQLLDSAELSEGTRRRSLAVFERLAQAEAKVHRIAVEAVHFHEVGAVDSLCDVVAACAALDYLGASVTCSPLPLGRGFVQCRHGTLPLPAPATVECLVGLQTYGVDLDVELVTPTAAAVLGALTTACVRWPSGVVRASGWGIGSQTLPDRPNVLRAVLYEPVTG